MHRPFKFLIAGGVAVAAELLSFVLLTSMTSKVLFSNSVSFLLGLTVSFTLNKVWVFGTRGRGKSQFSKYVLVALANLLLSNLIIGFLVYNFNIAESISKVIVMATIATWNYLVFSKFIFNIPADVK